MAEDLLWNNQTQLGMAEIGPNTLPTGDFIRVRVVQPSMLINIPLFMSLCEPLNRAVNSFIAVMKTVMKHLSCKSCVYKLSLHTFQYGMSILLVFELQ